IPTAGRSARTADKRAGSLRNFDWGPMCCIRLLAATRVTISKIGVLNDSAPMLLHELKDRIRYLIGFAKASGHFIGDIQGDIAGPSFGGVEGDDAEWIVVLAREQVADHRLTVSSALVGAPQPAVIAKVVEHEVR